MGLMSDLKFVVKKNLSSNSKKNKNGKKIYFSSVKINSDTDDQTIFFNRSIESVKDILLNAQENNKDLQDLYVNMFFDTDLIFLSRKVISSVSRLKPILTEKEDVAEEVLKFQKSLLSKTGLMRFKKVTKSVASSYFYGFSIMELIIDYSSKKNGERMIKLLDVIDHDRRYFERFRKGDDSDTSGDSSGIDVNYANEQIKLKNQETDELEDLNSDTYAIKNQDYIYKYGLFYFLAIDSFLKYYNKIDWSVYNEKYGSPFLDVEIDNEDIEADDDEYQAVEEQLEDGIINNAFIHTKAVKLEYKEPSNRDNKTYKSFKEDVFKSQCLAILGQDMDSSSSSSVNKLKIGTYIAEEMSDDIMSYCEYWLNVVMEKLVIEQFDEEVEFAQISLDNPKNKTIMMQADIDLSKMGVEFNKMHFVNKYELSDDEFDVNHEEKSNSMSKKDDPSIINSPEEDDEKKEEQTAKDKTRLDNKKKSVDGTIRGVND